MGDAFSMAVSESLADLAEYSFDDFIGKDLFRELLNIIL
jgi:hypothetical protein